MLTFQPAHTYDTAPGKAPIAATPTAMITMGGIDSYGIVDKSDPAGPFAPSHLLN